MNQKLTKATRSFAQKYKTFKAAEEQKNKKKDAFFAALTEHIRTSTTLPRKTVRVNAPAEEEIAWLKTHHPGWILVVSADTDKGRRAVIERDPAYMKRQVVLDGMVYGRNVSEKASFIDMDRLKKEDKDLWKAVTRPTRVLKDSSKWTEEQSVALVEYMTPGALQVSIAPPRPAKPEDLEEEV
jgi:hypothetical protein